MIETSCELNSRRILLVLLEFQSVPVPFTCLFGVLLSMLLSQPFLLKPIATASHDSTSRRSFPGEGAWDRRAFRHDERDRGSMIKDADRSVRARHQSPRLPGAANASRPGTRVSRATKNVIGSFRGSIPDEKRFFPGISVPVLTLPADCSLVALKTCSLVALTIRSL